MKETVEMVFSRTTKGTVVFEAVEKDAPITSLYVRKLYGKGLETTKVLTVTLESVSK